MTSNTALIVLGMHRSGTSLLSGLLAQLGVEMGRNLYAAQSGVNEKGFWEHGDIVDTHDALLLQLASQWDDLLPLPTDWHLQADVLPFAQRLMAIWQRDFSQVRIWALKDPRMCRLLPLWLPLLAQRSVQVAFVYMNRNPLEVVGSLQKRDGFSKEKALLLWLNHSFNAELDSRHQPRVFIDFDQVVSAPCEALAKIECGLQLHFPISIQQAQQKINEFVSPKLRHHKASDERNSPHQLTALACRLHHLLNHASQDDVALHQQIDELRAEWQHYQQQWPVELLEQIAYLNQERANYQHLFFQIYTAWSWRLVKPLWLIEKAIRQLKARKE